MSTPFSDEQMQRILSSVMELQFAEVIDFPRFHLENLKNWDSHPEDVKEGLTVIVALFARKLKNFKRIVSNGVLSYEQVRAIVITEMKIEPYMELINRLSDEYEARH